MPIPFDMLAVMLFLGWYAESPPESVPAPGRVALYCLGALLLTALASATINFIALRLFRSPGRSAASRRRIAGEAEALLRLALFAAFALLLRLSHFPWSAGEALGVRADEDGGHLFPIQLLGLLPYVCLFFAAWLPAYPLHRAGNCGVWTRRSFLLHKARYNLYILVAWLPFAFLADLLAEYLYLLPALFAAAAWVFPAALAKLWGCTPLRPGETTDLVRGLEERTGAAFSKIFLWEPGGGAMNAAAVGLARPFRYLFLTPGLVRGLEREELEAVILHELGHVRHRHLLFYLFTTLAGVNAAVLAGALLPLEGSAARFLATGALVLGYFRFVFGWLSRNMERQADLFSLERTGSARPLANALEKLGLAAGGIRLAASWHHLGIAERVDFLRRAERDPALRRAHNGGVRMVMATGYLASFGLLALFLHEAAPALFPTQPGASAAHAARDDREAAHWRRVAALLPADRL